MFELIRKTPMAEYNGEGFFYRDSKTGMEVFHVKNSSEELSAAFIFATPSQDSKGVAHILEHTVLCGSKRFPVKDPFSEIYTSSPNTFLNAMTFCDKTMYPFASPLKKDFDIIFDIYADSVFDPLLRKESFQQEGVRIFGGKIDGVVFNEMRGALSTEDSIVNTYSINKLYQGTSYQFDAGGNPRCIPDLTYEEYLDRYKLWYSPSNCRLFLYGDLDAAEYFKKIEDRYLPDDNLKRWNNTRITTPSDCLPNGDAVPLRDVKYCPTKDASSVVLTWLTKNGNDPFETLTLSILTDILLGNPGAPLYKAITDSNLGEDLNPMSGMDTDFPVLPFTVGFVGAKKNKEDEIEEFIISTLRRIAQEGLDKSAVQAALKRQAFKIREIQGGSYPYGIQVAMRCARYWLRGINPEAGLDNIGLLEHLENEVAKGNYFEKWIINNLVNNQRRCLLTVVEDSLFDKKLNDFLESKYKELEQSKEEQTRFDEFVNTKDSPDSLRNISRIQKTDLPERIPSFKMEERFVKDVPVRILRLFTKGIAYFNIAFETSGLSVSEVKLVPLLLRFLQMCGTKKHDYSQIGTLVKQLTGGFSIIQSSGTDVCGKEKSFVIVRTKCLNEDVSKALELTLEILLEGNFDDDERVNATLTDIITDFESEYLDSGNVFATLSAASVFSKVLMQSELTEGTESYLYLSSLAGKKNLGRELQNLHKKIFSSKNVIMQLSCQEEDVENLMPHVEEFVSSMPDCCEINNSIFMPDYFLSNEKNKKALCVSSGPSYNSVAFKLSAQDEEELSGAMLFASIISSRQLFEMVRGKNGAYGAECHVEMQEKVFSMSSYRDPSISETFKLFEKALSCQISQSDIDYTVVTILGKELRPLVPKNRSYEAFRRLLYGMTDELYLRRRRAILSKKVKDMEYIAKKLKNDFAKNNSSASICSAESLKNDLFVREARIINLPL